MAIDGGANLHRDWTGHDDSGPREAEELMDTFYGVWLGDRWLGDPVGPTLYRDEQKAAKITEAVVCSMAFNQGKRVSGRVVPVEIPRPE